MTPLALILLARELSPGVECVPADGAIVVYLPWSIPATGETGETAIRVTGAEQLRAILGY